MKTLREMIQTQDYRIYESESLSLQSNIINRKPDPETVTHQDIINCFREYLDTLDLPERTYRKIEKEIDTCEQSHEDQDTLDDVVYDYA